MLRISEMNGSGEGMILRLEGEMIGPWVDEVRKACSPFLGDGHRLTLDLSDLEFVDRRGVALFRELIDSQVRIINCSLFLTEQLKEYKNQLRND